MLYIVQHSSTRDQFMEAENVPQNAKEIGDNPKPDQAGSKETGSIGSALRQFAAKVVEKVKENIVASIATGIVTLMSGALALAWGVIFAPTQMPLGTFNIAIAEFGQVDMTGQLQPWNLGKGLSVELYTEVVNEIANIGSKIVVWSDSPDVKKKTTIGRLSSKDAAKAKANEINANLVIHGNLSITDRKPATFAPKFYVAKSANISDTDVIGDYQFGPDIPTGDLSLLENEMRIRTQVLILFAKGLSYDSFGDPDQALSYFTQTYQVQGWKGKGREVVDFFVGREWLNKKQYDNALSSFKSVIESPNSDDWIRARAYLGEGNVYYQRAEQIPDPKDRIEMVEQAVTAYSEAAKLPAQSIGELVEFKAHLTLGDAYRLEGEAYFHRGEYDTADDFYDKAAKQITMAITLANKEGIKQSLDLAYLGLGAVYHEQGALRLGQGNKEDGKASLRKATDQYTSCITYIDTQNPRASGTRKICDEYRSMALKSLEDESK
jgi:hypothetical protein